MEGDPYRAILIGILSHTKVPYEIFMVRSIVFRGNVSLPVQVNVCELSEDIEHTTFQDILRPDEICILAPRQADGSHHFVCSIWFRHFNQAENSIIVYASLETYERDAALYQRFFRQRYGQLRPNILTHVSFCHDAIECDDNCSCEPLFALAYAFYMSAHKIPNRMPEFTDTRAFHIDLRLKMANTLVNEFSYDDFRKLRTAN